MTTLRIRKAARVITLDPYDRVLLLRYEDNGRVFWATPGGSLETGETYQDAARREVREELGVEAIDLSGQIAERSSEHPVAGESVQQVERYYVARIRAEKLDPAQASNPDGITGRRWWRLEELRATAETVYPRGLGELIDAYLTQGIPSTPIKLS